MDPNTNPAPQEPPVGPPTPPNPATVPPTVSPTPPSVPPAAPQPAASAAPAQPVQPAQPMPTVMVGDGGMAPANPNVNPAAGPAAAPVLAPTPQDSGGRKRPKKLIWAAIALGVLIIGFAIWYFAYFNNPSVIYKQSLKNTGKGYDKLVDYADKQNEFLKQGYSGNGSYKVKVGDVSTDGKVAFKGDGENSELTFDVGLVATRVNADIRTIKSSGDTPDVYVKAEDIKGLGTVIGVPELDASLAKLDNTWIVIDHTLIDNLSGAATAQAQSSSIEGPTHEQLLDEARAFGKVNQEYVFSTAKDKAVTKVVTKYGKETVDGHKTYHYKIALQKDNVKKYIYAQRDTLKASKLNDWLKKNKYDKDVYASFDEAAKSTKDIKSSDTYDIWVDTSKRIVYKVRFSEKKNPAANYVDVGLNYQGGDTFPFFIAGKFKEDDTTTFKFDTTLDTKSGNMVFGLNVKNDSSENGGSVTANLTFKPGVNTGKISKPTNAKPLSQVLSELGFGDLLKQYTDPAATSASFDELDFQE